MKLIPFFIFLILAIFLGRGLYLDPQRLPSVQQGKPLPAFNIPILGNEQQSHFNAADLKGKITLLNVWASWCDSCAQEQVFLLKLAGKGMPIYGLNYKDDPEKALQWLQEWGNPYTTIGSDQLGKTAIDLGVYGTPETFLIDAQGLIVYRQVGVLDETSWNKEFLPRIRKLEKIG